MQPNFSVGFFFCLLSSLVSFVVRAPFLGSKADQIPVTCFDQMGICTTHKKKRNVAASIPETSAKNFQSPPK